MNIQLCEPFVTHAKSIIKQMANIDLTIKESFVNETEEINSLGVATIISCTGKLNGRFMLDMEPGLALVIAQNVTGLLYQSVKENIVLATISEINNIVSGNAISDLNNKLSLGLWLAPPIIMTGRDTIICMPKVSSVSMGCTTHYGKIRINIGFERGT